METATILTITILLLSLILIAVGVYLILLLNEARKSLSRINKILDRVEGASNFVEQNFFATDNRFVSIFGVLKEALVFIAELKKSFREEKNHHES